MLCFARIVRGLVLLLCSVPRTSGRHFGRDPDANSFATPHAPPTAPPGAPLRPPRDASTVVELRIATPVQVNELRAPASYPAARKPPPTPTPSPPMPRAGGGAITGRSRNSSTGSALSPDARRGRALSSVTVSSFADLASAVSGSATEIRLDAGTYAVTSMLSISSDVTITADVEGAAVVLDGQGSTQASSISSGTVQLVGLSIANAFAWVRPRAP